MASPIRFPNVCRASSSHEKKSRAKRNKKNNDTRKASGQASAYQDEKGADGEAVDGAGEQHGKGGDDAVEAAEDEGRHDGPPGALVLVLLARMGPGQMGQTHLLHAALGKGRPRPGQVARRHAAPRVRDGPGKKSKQKRSKETRHASTYPQKYAPQAAPKNVRTRK